MTHKDKVAEKLKDRRDYRNALIQRREDLEAKIKRVEGEIHDLKESEK
jgi:tetrahydromethanopterin S-methyltransferase subunit G